VNTRYAVSKKGGRVSLIWTISKSDFHNRDLG